MKLIVGLGNPTKQYENTRHNTGFKVVDLIAQSFNVSITQKKFNGLYVQFKAYQEDIILLKPQTYMNLSGESVIQFINYFKIDIEDVLIIMDELDLPVGKIRLKTSGSDGGQRGLRNIISHLKTKDINRLRIGIDNNKQIPTADYVLGKVEKEKLADYEKSLQLASQCAIAFIQYPINEVMNKYNTLGNQHAVVK